MISKMQSVALDHPALKEYLFMALEKVPWGCLRFVIVVFPDHTHLLFVIQCEKLPVTILSMSACRVLAVSKIR